ncbi:MAG: hypothetical protein AMXMBFR64_20850 [Myxococcales bacterium]
MNPLDFLDEEERDLVERAMVVIDSMPGSHDVVHQGLGRLGWLAQITRSYPSLLGYEVLGRRVRTAETLVSSLITLDRAASELELPVKAAVGRAFLIAKIQFFRSVMMALQQWPRLVPAGMLEDLAFELDQAVYTKLGEEVLLGLIYAPDLKQEVKHLAAQVLLGLWEKPILTEVTDFSPALESTWHARNELVPALGVLTGVAELFRLAQSQVAPEFLDFFARDGLSDDEHSAFREFLFGLLTEELERIAVVMDQEGLSVCDRALVERVLGPNATRFLVVGDSVSMYRAYRRRSLATEYRRVSNTPGPSQTAEGYIMGWILGRRLRES